MYRANIETLFEESQGPDPGPLPVEPNARKIMHNRSYPKSPGNFWNCDPIDEHEDWLDQENYQNPMPPKEFKDWSGYRLRSHRTRQEIGQYRKLSEAEKLNIVQNARSREDFHDLNKIMSDPIWGFCLCELRIISGGQCVEHLLKDKDGPDGKTPELGKNHWAWFIDPCPRGEMCPIAIDRFLEAEAKGEDFPFQGCDILIAEPTSEWVLEQHKDDPKGTIPGRVSTDIWLRTKCAACKGFHVDKQTNQLVEYQIHKWLGEHEHFLPKNYDPAEEDVIPDDWPRILAIHPCQFRAPNTSDYHPVLKLDHRYHFYSLKGLGVADEHIWLPGMNMTYKEYMDAKVKKREEKEQANKDQQIEDSKIAMKLTDHEYRREKLLDKLVANQRGCDDSAEEDDDD